MNSSPGAFSISPLAKGGEVLKGFLAPFSPETQKVYLSEIRQFLEFFRADLRLLKREDLLAYRDSLGDKHQEGTLKRKFSILKRFFDYLEGILPDFENPIKGDLTEFYQTVYWRSKAFQEEIKGWTKTLYSASTKKTYVNKVKLFFRWVGKTPEELEQKDFEEYRDHLLAQNYKPSSIWTHFVALNRFFKWRERHVFGFDNPLNFKALGLLPPGREKGYYRILTEEEAKRLLAAPDPHTLQGLRDRLVLGLMLVYGLRAGEVARLRFEDVDRERVKGQVRIWVRDRKGRPGRRPTTGIILSDKVLAFFDAWVDTIKKKGVKPEGKTCIILGLRGVPGRKPLEIDYRRLKKPLSLVAIENIVKRYVKKAKIDPKEGLVSAHALRHTALTFLARQRVRLEELKYLAGHQDVNTTMIYIRAAQSFEDHPGLYNPLNK